MTSGVIERLANVNVLKRGVLVTGTVATRKPLLRPAKKDGAT